MQFCTRKTAVAFCAKLKPRLTMWDRESRCFVFAVFVFASCLFPAKCNPNEGVKSFKELLSRFSEECKAKTKSDYAATMDMFYNGKEYNPGKCFVGCVMEKFGLMNKKGEILEKKIRESIKEIPNEHAKAIAGEYLEECLQKARDRNQCKKAFQFADCFVQHSRKKKGDSVRQ